MKALRLYGYHDLKRSFSPLFLNDIPTPEPERGELLIKVLCCGICHTELDEIEGRILIDNFPIVLGHQVIGKVEKLGIDSTKFNIGDRVGVGWIYFSCGKCNFCLEGNENLCKEFKATGRDINGGYSEFMIANENFAYKIPEVFSDFESAPLLCAGAIGYRSLKLTKIKNRDNIGLVGFGASAHLVLKLIKFKYPDSKIFVFTRSINEQEFAKELGADWCGNIGDNSPELLNAIIDTTPVWKPIVESLKNLAPNGKLIINAIRKENIDKKYLLKIDYPSHLWMEKEIKSVANVSRADISEFLNIASQIQIKPEIQEYDFEDANLALLELKNRKIKGAKILKIH